MPVEFTSFNNVALPRWSSNHYGQIIRIVDQRSDESGFGVLFFFFEGRRGEGFDRFFFFFEERRGEGFDRFSFLFRILRGGKNLLSFLFFSILDRSNWLLVEIQ